VIKSIPPVTKSGAETRWVERFNPWVGLVAGLVAASLLGLVGSLVFHAWVQTDGRSIAFQRVLPVALGGLVLGAVLLAYFLETTTRLRLALGAASMTREALVASEALFRVFAENTPAGLFIVKGTQVVQVNPAMSELSGFTQEELLTKEWFELVHPDEHGKLAQRALARQRGEDVPSRYEVRLRRKDGSVRWVEVSVSLVGFDGDAVTFGTVYDVTERREMLQRLQESEQRHRLLADNASDVIWTMDLNGRFTYVSPSVEKLRGYTVAEVMQQSMDQVLTPESLRDFTERFAEVVAAQGRGESFPAVRAEVEQPCKDGSTVWTEVTASAIVDEQGEFVGILGVSRDVTERRRDAMRAARGRGGSLSPNSSATSKQRYGK
jgi:PAS domain S-box-containing protein